MDEELAYLVLSVVEEIPARLVARVLSHAQEYGSFPCHRVVDHSGRIAPGWPEQAHLLAQEGVPFRDPTHVDMKRAQWEE